MYLKDYYQVLEIPASASIAEIKTAYRRLAKACHPDKNPNDPYSHTRFNEIKEAYEILTNPAKKEAYLQHRWYQQSMGQKKRETLVTPVSILKLSLELERYVSKLDVFRMDKYGLHDHISSLLDNPTIEKLNTYNDTETNNNIVQAILGSINVLPLELVQSIHDRLILLHTSDETRLKLDRFLISRKKANQRDRLRIWLILITVIILCLLIFFLAEK